MRSQLSAALLLVASAAPLHPQSLAKADSALVARVLTAEDRRDPAAAALVDGTTHRDPRIRLIARRARARIVDPTFADRDSFPAPTPAPSYEDPAWRLRYRALATKPIDCARLAVALADSAWPVRLRAADLATAECAADAALDSTLRRWMSVVPANARRRRGETSWQPAAHALLAMTRLAPADARAALPRFAKSPVPWVRVYTARAAAALADTTLLRRLAGDRNDNVKEAAISALSKVAGHASDDVFRHALADTGYQVVRAAAIALKGSTDSARVIRAARGALTRLALRPVETSLDARTALADRLHELGDSTASPALAHSPVPLPLAPDAVGLALGRDYRLRVTLADSSGGGSFVVRLRGDVAPIAAARVLQLVRAGWYNGRTWYRVEPDFVIQGGGPGSNEYVGYPRFVRDELSALMQVRGTVGMSTRGHDTGDAQWFINLRDNSRLTRDYTTFGEIVGGIDVVDGILEGDVIARIDLLPPKPHD
jgi:cyclophilin family peptidyl-prolyl cis-trans isomerase